MRGKLLLKLMSLILVLFVVTSCGQDETVNPSETCIDGVQNQDETGVDCGGVCDACIVAETCIDGIQNQDETGIDCGGVCDACAEPQPSKEYWVKFKLDNNWYLYEQNGENGYSASAGGAAWSMGNFDSEIYFRIAFHATDPDISSISQMEGRTFTIPDGFEATSITQQIEENNGICYYTSSSNGSSFEPIGQYNITSIEAMGPLGIGNFDYYVAEGTFQSEMVNSCDQSNLINLTEGSFKVYFVD